jgi:hypothetical protein
MAEPDRERVPGRRARRLTITLLSLAAASVVLTVAGVAAASGLPSTSPQPAGSGGAPARVESDTTATPAACQSDQLAASVVDGGSVASQPYAVIGLRNVSGSACLLDGYPAITATGYPRSDPGASGPLRIAVTDGALYSRPDPGPGEVIVEAGGWANFSLGTGTGYDDQYIVTAVGIAVPGGGTLALDLTIWAGAPAGQDIPVGVTAFAAGS